MTPQAASQTLAQLEQHLGVRLMHRTTRSLALTDERQRLQEATQPALAALERALLQARESEDEIAGPLHIVGPHSAFAAVLMPVVDEFCKRYPDIQPDVQLEVGVGNWVLDRVDVGSRIGASPEEGVIARRLFPLQMLICGAPAVAAHCQHHRSAPLRLQPHRAAPSRAGLHRPGDPATADQPAYLLRAAQTTHRR